MPLAVCPWLHLPIYQWFLLLLPISFHDLSVHDCLSFHDYCCCFQSHATSCLPMITAAWPRDYCQWLVQWAWPGLTLGSRQQRRLPTLLWYALNNGSRTQCQKSKSSSLWKRQLWPLFCGINYIPASPSQRRRPLAIPHTSHSSQPLPICSFLIRHLLRQNR